MYATRAELVAYAPADAVIPDEPEASRLLARASEAVEELTFTAIYDTDADGMPVDPEDVAAFRDATCAQAVHWLETGDESGQAGQWGTVSIGSVSLSRNGAGNADGSDGRTPDTVSRPLRLAGLLPGYIVHR
ncbi:hypothetical protein [Saccharopolyspora taberi]|uniref:hypothetical protein n=1 Tax=Saccharopolyspora taberi TaxID=60895 RepID=UPI0031E3C3A4